MSNVSSCKQTHESVLALAAGASTGLNLTACLVGNVVSSPNQHLYRSWLQEQWLSFVQVNYVPDSDVLWHSLEDELIHIAEPWLQGRL